MSRDRNDTLDLLTRGLISRESLSPPTAHALAETILQQIERGCSCRREPGAICRLCGTALGREGVR